jgi:GH43 family beta-xylosidase
MRRFRAWCRPTLHAARFGIVACSLLMALASFGAAPAAQAAPSKVKQPRPTSTPAKPGISIAQKTFDLPDPFILTDNHTYYLYLSTAFGETTQNIPVFTGRPGHWSARSVDAVPYLPEWASPTLTWSPAVYKLDGRYVMYFSPLITASSPPQHCIAIATASKPTGPFQVRRTPFICQRNLGGDIDPQLFVDPHGPDGPNHPNYLVWKSDNNSTPGDGIPTIWARPLSNDGLTLVGKPASIFKPTLPWQQPLVEAPQMALSPQSKVWLFFSAGTGFFSPNYAMGAVRCKSPLGPCNDPQPYPLIASNDQGSGPGEETYFQGPDGSDWLLYSPIHTAAPPEVDRPVEAARIGWGKAGPYVAAAGTFPSPS